MRFATFSAWLLLVLPALAHAQAQPTRVCNPKKTDCGCERNWGCWELVYTTKGTLLGFQGSSLHVSGGGHDRFDAAGLTVYATEHYGTHRNLTGHFLTYGALGGGSASTEGQLRAALDFGFRSSLTATSGFFLRSGPSGMLLGNQRLQLSLFQPLESRLGYQLLDGDRLFELGVTFGPVLVGRYDAEESRRNLNGSSQLRSYAALRFARVRFEISTATIRATGSAPSSALSLARGGLCWYPRPLAVCGEALYVTGAGTVHGAALAPPHPTMHAFYSGLSVGLTP